jgi:FkbM family methyltransferase
MTTTAWQLMRSFILRQPKELVRSLIRLMGYDIRKIGIGQDAYLDIRRIIGSDPSPVLFDVGANIGQTINRLQELFPFATIHAFEPGQAAFNRLLETYSKIPRVHLNNLALGSKQGRQIFFENSLSVMSSFLPLGPDGWGLISSQREIEVSTVDGYCSEHNIPFIDLLKTDTQGFDLDVIKGARGLLNDRKIHLLYLEHDFQKAYVGYPRLDEVYRFISDQEFDLISFYRFDYRNGLAGYTNALFIQRQFQT